MDSFSLPFLFPHSSPSPLTLAMMDDLWTQLNMIVWALEKQRPGSNPGSPDSAVLQLSSTGPMPSSVSSEKGFIEVIMCV